MRRYKYNTQRDQPYDEVYSYVSHNVKKVKEKNIYIFFACMPTDYTELIHTMSIEVVLLLQWHLEQDLASTTSNTEL